MRLPYRYSIILLLFIFSFWFWYCNPQSSKSSSTTYLDLTLEERQQAKHAVQAFESPEEIDVHLFASEPMLINPTNLTIDEKGRVWVCESYNYAVQKEKQTETGGRITILTDTDGDGKADERKVYYQGEDVNIALGISVLGNKVYVARSPHMLVFTDTNGDDLPDQKDTLFTGMGGPGDHSAHALVFGPDGRFYFNYGNAGREVRHKSGVLVTDQEGREVISDGRPYHGGMIFRCREDGSHFEVLGHNFRNNYEVAVDSYGNLWQSDNDDDGNKGVRINYILEYGNYGYLDERTGAHWTKPRTGMHDSIPMRHWHQNDPGVVPNLLHTGAGSPAGITVYEGNLLSTDWQGYPIHADAGPNVVRAYPTSREGAGYTAGMRNLIKSRYDQWFRPVDAAVAPDGSILVADWYDPVVGGAAAGDHQKGRIFRITPRGKGTYEVPALDLNTLEGVLEGLKSPNEATRYLAWHRLKAMGQDARPAILQLWESDQPVFRARALWLLGRLSNGPEYVAKALQDDNFEIRKAGIRLARQLDMPLADYGPKAVNDPSPSVRAELAIALRPFSSTLADDLWVQLAQKHTGKDRWYLEALGIGAALHWDSRFSSWKAAVGDAWKTAGGRDIVWRARSEATLPLLAELLLDPSTSTRERLRYFRAFDFQDGPEKQTVLLRLLEADHPEKAAIQALCLQHLDAANIKRTPVLSDAIAATLEQTEGTWQFVDLIDRFRLTDKKDALLELGTQSFSNEIGGYAIRLLLEPKTFNGAALLKERIEKAPKDAKALVYAMRSISTREALELLQSIVLNDRLDTEIRSEAIRALGTTWWGEDFLLETVKETSFPNELKPVAASILFSVYRTSIQDEAANYLTRPGTTEGEPLPPLRDLVATVGNPAKGKIVFQTHCLTCHLVQGEGVNFGPELSLIGDKLSKEGLFRAVIYPNEGINYNYETWQLQLNDGRAIGLLTGETEDQVDLKLVGGMVQSFAKSAITNKEQQSYSLMPNLSLAMRKEELVDLVAYLAELRQEQ